MKVYSRPTTFSFRELSKQQTKRDIVHIYVQLVDQVRTRNFLFGDQCENRKDKI